MASGPNKTVAAFRNRQWSEVGQTTYESESEARTAATEARRVYPKPRYTVRVTSYRWGSFKAPQRSWVLRVYER